MQGNNPVWLTTLILIFITSPGEEIFWRGFLQRNFMDRIGRVRGWLLASILYAMAHISSLNFMLVMAALVAGLAWGLLFMFQRNLAGVIISHIVWIVLVFIVAPIG